MCLPCEAGTFSSENGESSCTQCGAGTFVAESNASSCFLCGAGTYSTGQGLRDASRCNGCEKGSFSTGSGLTHAGECQRCTLGSTTRQAGGTACVDCAPNEFPNVLLGACAACPINTEASVNAKGPEECRCRPGYRLGYNTRAIGGVESYRTDGARIRKIHAFSYVAGTTLKLLVATQLEATCGELTYPLTLTAGDYPVDDGCQTGIEIRYDVDIVPDFAKTETYVQCILCSPGTFSVGMAAFQCLPCPNRTFQDQMGATSCKSCPSASREYTGMPVCEPCPGRTVLQDEECRPCPEGAYNPTYNKVQECLRCPINMWSIEGADDCKLCPKNSLGPGATGLSGCRCAGGMELRGQECVSCVAGKYSPPGDNICLLCANGTFSQAPGASVCLSCGTSGVSLSGTTSCTSCVLGTIPSRNRTVCVPCPAGYYCGIGVVYACPLGTYSLKTGLTSKSQCPPCPGDYFCRSPLTIQKCPENTWSPEGSITRHYCRCNNGYICTYFMTDTGKIMISLTPDMIQEQDWIDAIAQAAGVHPSMVQLLSVTNTP